MSTLKAPLVACLASPGFRISMDFPLVLFASGYLQDLFVVLVFLLAPSQCKRHMSRVTRAPKCRAGEQDETRCARPRGDMKVKRSELYPFNAWPMDDPNFAFPSVVVIFRLGDFLLSISKRIRRPLTREYLSPIPYRGGRFYQH